MTDESSKKVCKGCRWKVNKFDKKEKKVIKWCVEGNCPIALLNKCPL